MVEKIFDKKGNIATKVDILEIDDSIKTSYLPSKYDVFVEATNFCNEHKDKLKKINILYGAGLGYHICLLQELLNSNQKLFVLENRVDIVEFANKNNLYEKFKDDTNINIFYNDDENIILKKIKEILDKYDEKDIYFFKNMSCVNVIHPKTSSRLRYYMKRDFEHENNIVSKLLDKMQANVDNNIILKDENSGIFFDKYKDVPAILVSAGPSFVENIEFIKKSYKKALIMIVSRNIKYFEENNIPYDFCCTIDPNDETAVFVEDADTSKHPLFYLSSANSKLINNYTGKRYISFNEDNIYFDKKYNVNTGGSVATYGFDLLVKFGCNPIIFVGQDLALINKQMHINEDTIEHSLVKTISNTGEILPTSNTMMSFKYWFENQIKKYKYIKFYNLSRGAVIEGTQYITEDDMFNIIDEKNKFKQ